MKKILIFFILLSAFLLLWVALFIGCGRVTTSVSDNRFSVSVLTNWQKEVGIRIEGAVSTSTISLEGGQYRIFYPGGDGVASYISSDGLTFSEEAGTRVAMGSAGDYDEKQAVDPDVVIEDGYYRMYYTAVGSDDKHRTMSAISSDGFTFTKEAGVRIDYDASYDQLADVQSVVKISDNNYKMYFVYDWYGDNSIKGATSTDGLSWEVVTLSGFINDCMDPAVLLDEDGTLVMFFAAPRLVGTQVPMDIYKAVSTDGINWTVVGRAITSGNSGQNQIVGDPDVIRLSDGSYRMYYYDGDPQISSNILSATAESL